MSCTINYKNFLFLLLFYPFILSAQDCSIKNKSFQAGERLEYNIYYYLAGLWVSAGEVEFEVNTIKGEKKYLQYYATGNTLPKYDWFYKVRDTYEAVADMETLLPYAFRRDVNEGSTYIREKYFFDHEKKKSYTTRQMDENEEEIKDTVYYSACSWDVLSIIYYARNLDFSQKMKGDKIPIKIFLDNQEHQSYIEYLGKDSLKMGNQLISCYKFSPLLIEGTIFKSGKGMTVWVTTDQNMLPLLVETPILVGSIKAKLRSAENLAHPTNFEMEFEEE